VKKGEEYFNALVSKLSLFLVELAGTGNDEIYT